LLHSYWVSPGDTYPLPTKSKREVPSGLKAQEKADYKAALELLDDDLRLDRWLNDRDPDASDSDEEDEEEQPAAKKAKRE